MQLMLAQKCAECRPDAFQMQVPTSNPAGLQAPGATPKVSALPHEAVQPLHQLNALDAVPHGIAI